MQQDNRTVNTMENLRPKNEESGQRAGFVLLMDMGISLIASLLSIIFLRFLLNPFAGFQTFVFSWLIAAAVCSLIAFLTMGTQKIVIRYANLRSIGRIATASLIKCVLMFPVIYFLYEGQRYSLRLLTITDFMATLVLLTMVRVVMIVIYDDLNKNVGRDVDRLCVGVYGIDDKSVALLTRLEQSPNYMIAGFLTRSEKSAGQVIQGKKVFSFTSDEELAQLSKDLGLEGVILPKMAPGDDMGALVTSFLNCGIHVLTAPQVSEIDYGGLSQHAVQSFSKKDDFIPDGMSSFERNTKRIIDCILAGILLIIFSPAFLLCYILVKREDGGPAIYSQERIGRFGRPFYIHKFRSMRLDAESMGPALYSGDEDPRLTKIGKFLRQHHLDELPQLWNVFVGDMAFIGYRPERQFYIDQIMEADPRYYYLYQIRPGVTSYATLRNGYTDTLEKMLRRLELDLYYLRHRSLWFDIKILGETFLSIVFGKKF